MKNTSKALINPCSFEQLLNYY